MVKHRFSILSFLFISFIIFLIFSNRSCFNSLDMNVLYNRACQVYTCLSDGNLPFFYYKDFNNLGYTSSFLYGDMILLPFSIITRLGFGVFTFCYVIFTVIILYTSIYCLAKSTIKNYKESSLILLVSDYILFSLIFICDYQVLVAISLSLFLIVYYLNAIRNKDSSIFLPLLFYLLTVNTNMFIGFTSILFTILISYKYYKRRLVHKIIWFYTGVSVLSIPAILYLSTYTNPLKALLSTIESYSLSNLGILTKLLISPTSMTYFSILVFCLLLFLVLHEYDFYIGDGVKELGLILVSITLFILSNTLYARYIPTSVTVYLSFYGVVYIVLSVCKNTRSKTYLGIIVILSLFTLLYLPFSFNSTKTDAISYTSQQLQIKDNIKIDTTASNVENTVLDGKFLKVKLDIDQETELVFDKLYLDGYKLKLNGRYLETYRHSSGLLATQISESGVATLYYDNIIVKLAYLVNYIYLIVIFSIICYSKYKDSKKPDIDELLYYYKPQNKRKAVRK